MDGIDINTRTCRSVIPLSALYRTTPATRLRTLMYKVFSLPSAHVVTLLHTTILWDKRLKTKDVAKARRFFHGSMSRPRDFEAIGAYATLAALSLFGASPFEEPSAVTMLPRCS